MRELTVKSLLAHVSESVEDPSNALLKNITLLAPTSPIPLSNNLRDAVNTFRRPVRFVECGKRTPTRSY